MSGVGEERELYWYDDATYDIGFYNYYKRTVDPSPWAFIVCLLFCVILTLWLPRYLSYYRTMESGDAGEEYVSKSDSRRIIFGFQEFIASDAAPLDGVHSNLSKIKHKINLPSVDEEISPVESGKTLDADSKIVSSDYTNMEDTGADSSLHSATARDRIRLPATRLGDLNDTEDYPDDEIGYGEFLDPEDTESQSRTTTTSNPLQSIRTELTDLAKNRNVNDSLSIASSWEEVFDPAAQVTLYVHPATGLRTTEKPVEPISDVRSPWYLFYGSSAFRRKIRKCARWDDEMDKILGLALPYTIHTVAVDVFGLLEVGIIGRLLGTTDLSAYFATEFAISFATMFFHGILTSLKVLVSQAHGADNIRLAGTYVQIGVWMHHIFSLPLVLYGWNHFYDISLSLGLAEETAEVAEKYARVALIYEAIGIYDRALHLVLDVTGHEKYSAISNAVRAFFSYVTVCIFSRFNEETELWMIGAIHLIVKIFFFFFNICIMFYNHWLDDYRSELAINNPFRDWRPIKTLWKASLRLSSGRVIEISEWNILFVFAAIQGPAEVVVWGSVGKLWDFADNIVIAVSDGSKVRCAHLLGSGLPEQAKYSSEKSLFLGVVVSLILSISLGVFRPAIPGIFTNDFTLQRLLGDMIPMICLAVATLSFGSVCWSILCAQGRAHLATAVTGFGTLVIALPLACLSNFCFKLNLQGLIACLIIGYASSGFFHSVLVLTSNWTRISQKVRKRMIRTEEKIEKNKASYIKSAESTIAEGKSEDTGD